jgi:hypothetical protein
LLSLLYTLIHTYQSGVFAAGEDYFLDPDCDKPFIKIRSDGVLAYTGSWSAQPGGYVIERNAPYVGVTPMMPQAVDYLTTNCPCGLFLFLPFSLIDVFRRHLDEWH